MSNADTLFFIRMQEDEKLFSAELLENFNNNVAIVFYVSGGPSLLLHILPIFEVPLPSDITT
jgi:hypothetical protein